MLGGAYRVVIVDDAEMFRNRLVEDVAATERVQVVGTADTEAEAIALIEQTAPDAAIVDVSLRDGSGLNVVREVRKHFPAGQLCIVVLTNFSYAAVRDRSMEFGANHFFDKADEYHRVCELIHDLAARRSS
jgi:DNA-binding NarL/FixJ family response regulator